MATMLGMTDPRQLAEAVVALAVVVVVALAEVLAVKTKMAVVADQ